MLASETTAPTLTRAAQYVRMSTDHQQYSTDNQADVIREYAKRRGFEIVRTYADEGKSGLSVAGRDSLKRMIADVQAGAVDFKAILVYDVSRWGRFQDADESAFHEYLCKRAGIDVHYCAEQFENDGGPTSTIIKSVKRAMAGEYSRELSAKVFKGQCRLIELGYRQGGAPGFGLRRMLINQTGESKGLLNRGEKKSLQTDRVILVPGPDEEVGIVRWIYEQFIKHGRSESDLAAELNANGRKTDLGRQWSRGTINQILTNEKYIGNNVYNRTSFKLKKKHVVNSPEMWVRGDGAFDAVIPPDAFYTARGIVQERARRLTNEEMLAKLRSLADHHANLSCQLIDSADGMPTSNAYRARFGSLLQAYRQAGFDCGRDYTYLEINRQIRSLYPGMIEDMAHRLGSVGATVSRDGRSGLYVINGEYSATIALARCRESKAGALQWVLQLNKRLVPDIAILARMDAGNTRPVDFYLLPVMDLGSARLTLCETNGPHLDTYQFDSLDYFAALAKRRKVQVAA